MTREFILPESEKRVRIEATSPALDAWVSANAGSGKTTILRNRVIRLLLEGTAPDRVLCLTYTKAAAAEMQGRIFSELARWVTLDDATLADEIARLTGREDGAAPAADLALARTLFARAMEAPGGLKIQTIHAFAERILHLFPLEAGVPLNFEVLDAADAKELRLLARQAAIDAAVEAPASALGLAFGEILSACNPAAFVEALDAAVDELAAMRMRDEALPPPGRRDAAYRAALGVPAGETLAGIDTDFAAAALDPAALNAVAALIRSDTELGISDSNLAANFERVARLCDEGRPWIDAYLGLFLTGDLEAKVNAFTKGIKKRIEALVPVEEAGIAACAAHVERRRAFLTFTRSLAMAAFAEYVLDHFEHAKAARNTLDFSDLIAALRRLLAVADAGWIMMKLDASIEHVLIDEAQDTTREMWDIVRGLTAEFFAGEGRTRRFRSIFVVGDEKQSIFSFQGADPAVFEESRRYFAEKSLRPEHIRKPVALSSSFRSSSDILAAVDQVFAAPERAAGLTASGEKAGHIAARQKFPGLVELWPLELPRQDEPGADAGDARSSAVLLAERIGERIAAWLDRKERHLVDGRPVRAGDILILVQQRNAFFAAMLKALKRRGIPVSGADRMKLQEELVVRDLLVVAEAALLEGDDLALATALKTPLFGLTDADLEDIGRNRPGTLRAALAAAPRWRPLAEIWRALAAAARAASPFEFFSGLLAAPAPANPSMSGRKAILGRLGPDAGDPLDAFLLEAEAFARKAPASVLLFTLEQRQRETELKRDLEHGGDKVRVMTVHGSKGLEARIVFLGDTVSRPSRSKEKSAFALAGGGASRLIVWAGRKPEEASPLRVARAEARRRQFAEYRRLLYVGMTRAADRLYVAGYRGKLTRDELAGKAPKSAPAIDEMHWYGLVEAGFAENRQVRTIPPDEPGGGRALRRLVSDLPPAPPGPDETVEAPAAVPLPDWLMRPPPQPEIPLPPLRPSKGPAAPMEAAEDDGARGLDRRRRGILLHRLFETLPRLAPEVRQRAGLAWLAQAAPGLPREAAEQLVASVIVPLGGPSGEYIFGPASRPEVAVAGSVRLADGGSRRVAGRIDRLIVAPGRIGIVDLKTGVPHPAADDPAILRQMALYRALMQGVYPGRAVDCAVFWVETGMLDDLPAEALDGAFAAVALEP